jgi:transcription antitermination factor NusG
VSAFSSSTTLSSGRIVSAGLVSHALELAARHGIGRKPEPPPPVVDYGPFAWYVLQTIMHGEDDVCEGLAVIGFESYVPMMRKEITNPRSHKTTTREFRLFNRYVFAFLPANTRAWRTVEAIDGYDAVLGDGAGPVAVPEADIARFKHAEAARQFDVTKAQRFPVGSRIRVVAGAFGGFAGLVESLPGRGVVKAMVEIFGRYTPVQFPFDNVEPE